MRHLGQTDSYGLTHYSLFDPLHLEYDCTLSDPEIMLYISTHELPIRGEQFCVSLKRSTESEADPIRSRPLL